MEEYERTGEAFELSEQLTVVGRKLVPGDLAPPFTLDYFDPKEEIMSVVRLDDSAGSVRLLNVVNSLDTPVCYVETQEWEKLRNSDLTGLPKDVVVYTISMDLPFAQARWCKAENVTHAALSCHRDEQFGRDYGVLLKEWRLLQRAVFVIDDQDRIVYTEYVSNQLKEPDYAAAITAARTTASA